MINDASCLLFQERSEFLGLYTGTTGDLGGLNVVEWLSAFFPDL